MSEEIYIDPVTNSELEVVRKHSHGTPEGLVVVEHKGVPLIVESKNLFVKPLLRVGKNVRTNEIISGREFVETVHIVAMSEDGNYIVVKETDSQGKVIANSPYATKKASELY